MSSIADLFRTARREPRPRLFLDVDDTLLYAVGDVHGCLDKLTVLEAKIAADSSAYGGRKMIVMLGDYIDRGPRSAGVLEKLAGPPPKGFERICLAGNHDLLMLDYLEGRCDLDRWLSLGGAETLSSYGIDLSRLGEIYSKKRDIDAVIRSTIPQAHAEFLRGLPVIAETPRHVFVHAGFRPEIPIAEQSDDELVSIRDGFRDKGHLLDRLVVHGHTPVRTPERDGRRLNIDTGACLGRRLTAIRIYRGKGRFIQS